MSELMTECVGLHFRPSEVKTFVNEEVGPGYPLNFEREPSNPYDSSAIKVMAEACHIGYIPKTSNGVLAMLMDTGDAVNVRGKVHSMSGKRIEIEVNWDDGIHSADKADGY